MDEPNRNRRVDLKGSGSLTFSGEVTASVKTNFAVHHLLGASHFANLSNDIETENRGVQNVSEDVRSEHRAYVVGAIMLAVAGLEAFVNELFLAAVN